jgi:hypothetical protein
MKCFILRLRSNCFLSSSTNLGGKEGWRPPGGSKVKLIILVLLHLLILVFLSVDGKA